MKVFLRFCLLCLAAALCTCAAPTTTPHEAGTVPAVADREFGERCGSNEGTVLADLLKVGRYTAVHCRNEEEGFETYDIYLDDVLLVSDGESSVMLGLGGRYRLGRGEDVTGYGMPILAVVRLGAGTCCSEVDLFDLSPKRFRHLIRISIGEAAMYLVRHPDGKGYALAYGDDAYTYWRTGYADSPLPTIYYEYSPGFDEYVLSPRLMHQPAPAPEVLRQEANALRPPTGISLGTVPVDLWSRMLDLIYSGNAESARQLLTWAWPEDEAGRNEFWRELVDCKVRSSRIYGTIALMNGWDPRDKVRAGC